MNDVLRDFAKLDGADEKPHEPERESLGKERGDLANTIALDTSKPVVEKFIFTSDRALNISGLRERNRLIPERYLNKVFAAKVPKKIRENNVLGQKIKEFVNPVLPKNKRLAALVFIKRNLKGEMDFDDKYLLEVGSQMLKENLHERSLDIGQRKY